MTYVHYRGTVTLANIVTFADREKVIAAYGWGMPPIILDRRTEAF